MKAPLSFLAVFLIADAVLAEPYTERQQPRVTPIVELVRASRGAVVNIAATHIVDAPDPFLDFFDTHRRRQVKTNSVGSGAVIHPFGYVLTNAHVVAQASELKVLFADGRELPAEVVSSLPESDLAVLYVKSPTPLAALQLGTSSDLMVGETVVAIGNPVGLGHTVTTGIVSALDREVTLSRDVTFTDIIQTDAAINPGNSGGPLLNVMGELIGVNTAIRSDAQNVGFAIPVDRVKTLLPELLAVKVRGRVTFGVQWGGEKDGGVEVAAVLPGSPAARGGLKPGHVVRAVAGVPVAGVLDALVTTLEQPIGQRFPVLVFDGARERALSLRVERLPVPDGDKLAQRQFGLFLVELDAAAARQLGMRAGAGLQVARVEQGTAAHQAGLRPGDLIIQVGRYGVRSLAELGLLLEDLSAGDRVPFVVVRFRGRGYLRSVVVLPAR